MERKIDEKVTLRFAGTRARRFDQRIASQCNSTVQARGGPPALPLRSARPWRQMAGGLRLAFGMFIKEKKIFLPSLEYTLYIHFIC